MNEPALIIVHRLSNRIRFRLSHPLKNIDGIIETMKNKKGINKFEYNPLIKSLLIEFNTSYISMEEVVMRLAVLYSKEYDLAPVKLMGDTPTRRNIPVLGKYSILSIVGAAISRVLVTNKNIQEVLNWIAVSTTIGATIEHAYSELNTNGAFDPEVVSIMYLINSVRKGNFLQPSIITWFTTFGRHLINPSYEKAIIKINEFDNKISGESYYTVSVSPHQDINKKVNFIKQFISKSIEKQKGSSDLIITDNYMGTCENRFCRIDRGCEKISFN